MVVKQLTTLSLCVAMEEGVRQVDAEGRALVDHLGKDLWDAQGQLHASTGQVKAVFRVGWVDSLLVYVSLEVT